MKTTNPVVAKSATSEKVRKMTHTAQKQGAQFNTATAKPNTTYGSVQTKTTQHIDWHGNCNSNKQTINKQV